MSSLLIILLLLLNTLVVFGVHSFIDGVYAVKVNDHYSNKTNLSWGVNDDDVMSVLVKLSLSAATYNCSNTNTYTCEDTTGWMYDWNKLWGKSRCGDYASYHINSDRFVYRRCSDSSCDGYIENENRIQLGAYSYDDSNKPYDGLHPDLMKTFTNTIKPDQYYNLTLVMSESGLSSFILSDPYNNNEMIETQYITHNKTCSNYSKGLLAGLYFGGTCTASSEIVVHYSQSI